jgi:hypothetical protein
MRRFSTFSNISTTFVLFWGVGRRLGGWAWGVVAWCYAVNLALEATLSTLNLFLELLTHS